MNTAKADEVEFIKEYHRRIAIGNTHLKKCRWDEGLEIYQSVLTDARSSKIMQSNKEDVEGKKDFLKFLEKMIRIIRENAKIERDIFEQMNRSTGSPEPPADPDVWSPPPQPARQPSQKKSSGQANRQPSKSTSSLAAGTSYSSIDKTEKPANAAQSLLPPNKQGEVFDVSPYDSYLVQAIRSTMELSSENKISLDEVIGMEDVKRVLHEAITLPLLIPDFFKGLRSPWKALCLAGPPGTGKTLIARAIASESGSTYFTVSPADLSSKWRGDSEKIVKILFEVARFYAPSIIFIDEIDTMAGQRGSTGEHEASRRVKSELLQQMDGARHKFDERRVFVLAATNIPWELDEALRRRFEKRIFVPLPEYEARRKLIENALSDTNVSEEVDFDSLARQTDGFSGADMVSLCKAAAYNVLRRFQTNGLNREELSSAVEWLKKEPVKKVDFDLALKTTSSSVNMETNQKCKEWCETFGSN